MRNKVILSTSIATRRDVDSARTIIDSLGEMVGGILHPVWDLHRSLLNLTLEKGATIWLNGDSIYPDHLCREVSRFLRYIYPEPSFSQEIETIPIGGLIMPCHAKLIMYIRACSDGIEDYRSESSREIPSDWQLPLFPIAGLTFEERDRRILSRARIAQSHQLPGVVVPCDLVSEVQAMGLKAVVAGIRDSKYPVESDYQVITCSPREAWEAGADYFVIGSPITRWFRRDDDLEKTLEAANYFIGELTKPQVTLF